MASKRRIRRRSCENKKRYPVYELAERDAIGLQSRRRREGANFAGVVRPYKCKFCNQYHVGHLDKSRAGSLKASIGRFYKE